MTNTLLTPQQITREALRVLHQKLNFIGNINRQYDDSFAKTGAKIGNQLRIRQPNQYTVRTGAALSTQDTLENQTTLTVGTQKGVDLNFTSVDLTLSLDDFSGRILDPAMAVLAASMEADALTMVNSVWQVVGTPGTVPNALLTYLLGKARLDNSLTPADGQRSALLSPNASATIVDALKGLFQDSGQIAQQYKEGRMGRTAGFDWYENTLMPSLTVGSNVTGVTVNGAGQGAAAGTLPSAGMNLNVGGLVAAQTYTAGTTFTIAGVFEVHPETKAVTSRLQTFVITSNFTAGGTTGTLAISPAIVTSGGTQNVSAQPAASAAITFQTNDSHAWAANGVYEQELLFHKDAFTFATADLVMPKGVDFAAREVFDGVSMRIVRAYDINNDKFPCRLDVLYGYQTLRPQLACRVTS